MRNWVSQAVDLLRALSECIDSTLDAWELFLEGDIHYLITQDRATSMPGRTNYSMIAIHKIFRKMKSRSKELKNLIKKMNEDIPRDVRSRALSPTSLDIR